MIFAALLLFAALPLPKDADTVIPEKTAVAARNTDHTPAVELTANAEFIAPLNVSYVPGQPVLTPLLRAAAPTPAAEPAAAPSKPFRSTQPVRVLRRQIETERQRRIWYGLAFAGHAGAVLDAWSTRRALSNNPGLSEADPFQRPFAGNSSLYVTTQLSAAVMDFLGRRMMTSRHQWIRRVWWVPQTAGATFSFAAGIHNVGLVH